MEEAIHISGGLLNVVAMIQAALGIFFLSIAPPGRLVLIMHSCINCLHTIKARGLCFLESSING